MKNLKFPTNRAIRLFALILCLAATVPQLGATARVYVRCDGVNASSSYLYVWGSSEATGGWRGTAISSLPGGSVNLNGYTYYYVDIDQDNINLIFNNTNGQTADINIANSGTYYFTYNGGNSYYGPNDYADGALFVVGDNTSIFTNGWDTGDATLMQYSGGTYTWTSGQVHLDANANYTFKVRDNNDNWYPSGDNATFSVNTAGTYTITITKSDSGDPVATPTLVTADPSYTYNIYVRYKGSENVSNVYAFVYDSFGIHPLGDWGGTSLADMTATTINGYTYYTASFTSYDSQAKAIFNENESSSTQTANLTLQQGDNYFTYSGGSTASGPNASADPATTYYAESDFAGWTGDGTQMTDNGDGSYSKIFNGVHLNGGTAYGYKVYGNDGTTEGVWIGVNGDNATFTPTVSGTYDVTITLNSDGTISHTLTMIAADPIYITGSSGLGLTWDYAPETMMTYDDATGYYIYTYDIAEEGIYNFVFGNGQGEDWTDFNGNYRIGPTTSNNQAIPADDNWNTTQMAAGGDRSYSVSLHPGTMTITFDPTNMRFKVHGATLTYNYKFYVLPSDHQTVPHIYLWGLGTDETYSNAYPGTRLTTTEVLADGNTWYLLDVDLTVEYIHALVNGGGDNADNTKTQDITHIDPGTYYIYWETERASGASYNDYLLTNVAPTASGNPLYLIGTYYYNKEQYHYDSNSGVQLKYDAASDTYYLNNVNFAVHNTFCFTTQLSDNWDDVGTRYGNSGSNDHVVGDGVTNYFAIDENWINKNIALDEWSNVNGEYHMLVPGIYNILVNINEKWVRLIKTDYHELTPMNVYLEQTDNVYMVEHNNNFIQDPGTEYTTDIFGNGNWPLAAYNGTYGNGVWDPHENGNSYPVTFLGDTITADGKTWWHWQVEASIAELFFTRLNKVPLQSDTLRRKAGVVWVTWDEVDGEITMTDHSREYFEAAANALPTNAVVMEGHYYVYFINSVDWDNVYCYAWDNNEQGDGSVDHTFTDGYSRLMSTWPGQPCELVGIDPVTGYEVWRYDFGTIIGTDIPNGGILFNDGNEYAETEAKEQTGDFEYVNGAVYDYLGMVDGAYTLNNLIRNGHKNVRYTLSNDLLGVYYDKDAITRIWYLDEHQDSIYEDIVGALYAKDLNLYGEKSIMPDDSYTDYVYDICKSDHTPGRSQIMIKRTTYDQSNWIKLVVSPNYDGHGAVVPKNERPNLEDYVGYIIPGGTLDIFMNDSINPEGHVLSIKRGDEMKYEPNVYVSEHFNDTVVFHFTHQDWLEPDAEYPMAYSCQPQITWQYDTIDGNVTVTGGTASRKLNYNNPIKMFYVAPKPQELAYITWVVYDNYNEKDTWEGYSHEEYTPYTHNSISEEFPPDPGRFYSPMNWNRTVYLDAAAYPSFEHLTEASEIEKALGAWSPEYGPFSNGYMQYGGFKVNWSLFDVDASGGTWWQIIKPGQAYKFLAIIRYARGSGENDTTIYYPSNGDVDFDFTIEKDDSAPGAVHNAPRHADDYSMGFANMYFTDYDYMDESKFIIFPIQASSAESNGNDLGNVTTVREVMNPASREVVDVRYYNLMGVESNKPFDGINIVVTTYNDGSRTSRKIHR